MNWTGCYEVYCPGRHCTDIIGYSWHLDLQSIKLFTVRNKALSATKRRLRPCIATSSQSNGRPTGEIDFERLLAGLSCFGNQRRDQ